MSKNRYNTQYIDIEGMPDTRDSEIQILADLINSPEYISIAEGRIKDEMFAHVDNLHAWKTLKDMNAHGETIDITTIGTKVNKDLIIEILDPRYESTARTAKAISDHCSALCSESLRRTLFLHALEMLNTAKNPSTSMSEILSIPGDLTDKFNSHVPITRSSKSIVDVFNELSEDIENNMRDTKEGKRTRIPTGFDILDDLTYSGFNGGNLVILSARPSVGKTAIMLQMARGASNSGFASSIYSLEMTDKELAQRLMFSTGEITYKQLMKGSFEWSDLEKAYCHFNGMRMFINDKARTLDDITSDIILGHQQGRCDIAFIDYLGLIQGSNPRMPLFQAISEKTARLKQLAKDCNIPIVLLCQLNRNSVSENREPQLYDLRDSGSIEQDADIVIMLDRESKELSDPNIDMYIRKNRHGKADLRIELMANETFTEFKPRYLCTTGQ